MNAKARVLVVDDKENIRKLFERFLGSAFEVSTADGGHAAMRALEAEKFDVVVTDVRMPDANGFDILRLVRERFSGTQVILVTGYASVPAAVEAMREGAYDYLQKPFDPDDVLLVVSRAVVLARGGRVEPPLQAVEALPPATARTYREVVEATRDTASKSYLVSLLREFHGNVSRAARHAGMERESLHRLLRRYGLRSESFKAVGPEDS